MNAQDYLNARQSTITAKHAYFNDPTDEKFDAWQTASNNQDSVWDQYIDQKIADLKTRKDQGQTRSLS